MHPLIFSAAIFATSVAAQAENQYTATATCDVAKARATAKTLSPTSHVKGKAFDRLAIIWLENTDYDMAIGDPNLAWLAKRGITLSNYHAVTHPSQPNYVASIGGDYFGMQHDDFTQIDKNVSTIIDLLEDKGISWGEYQEDMPYSGFEGMAYVNQKNGKNDYVRKHNPAVNYNSNAGLIDRLAVIKNLTTFYEDLENETLPQWMFITPNMTSDGHDTDVTVSGTWTRTFLEPLLSDKRFMQNTLVIVTFDENETYSIQNRILAILIGDAVPADLVGTTDDSYYNHYSEIATAEANWDLHTLGRFDVGANVFKFVADKTGDTVRSWSGDVPLADMYFNYSYAGALNDEGGNKRYPAPNLVDATGLHNRTILPSIKAAWQGSSAPVYYTSDLETPDGQHPPKGYTPTE
ncbi:phosphoesterase-domain-containing protein [Daldinia caldariorum]|uniref:phosphoesterase-domain-containing protein n=1 Tax=Daldinia caldariorum TaxID=326644 RepID=UPI002007CCD0|nr:phosphoesterase-domain-containing protein [Daldinia caldariorum]KAI1469502.1 phosphoesterase-domain-containing protein [Daldinia caldariorum]